MASRLIYQYLMGEPFFCQLSGESGVDLGKHIANIYAAAVTVRYRQISEQISRNRRLFQGLPNCADSVRTIELEPLP